VCAWASFALATAWADLSPAIAFADIAELSISCGQSQYRNFDIDFRELYNDIAGADVKGGVMDVRRVDGGGIE
jgi:hypothetical protein